MTSILTGNKVSKFILKETLTKHSISCCISLSVKLFFMTSLDGEAIQKFQNFMYLSSLTFFGKKGGILINEIQYAFGTELAFANLFSEASVAF